MTKLKDIIQQGTDQDIIGGRLTIIASQLEAFGEMVPIRPINDYQGFAVKQLLNYESKELNAAVLSFRVDICMFAWRVRNIFEGFLLLEHITKSDDNAAKFVAQEIGDEKTILLEGILSLKSSALPDTETRSIRERIEKAGLVLKNGYQRASPWKIDFLADAAGMKSDYDAFYKLYSKYVHPYICLDDSFRLR